MDLGQTKYKKTKKNSNESKSDEEMKICTANQGISDRQNEESLFSEHHGNPPGVTEETTNPFNCNLEGLLDAYILSTSLTIIEKYEVDLYHVIEKYHSSLLEPVKIKDLLMTHA